MAGTDGGGLRFDDRMSELDALLWGIERVAPAMRSTVTVVVTFDQRPDPDVVRQRVERLSKAVPRLRDRVVPGPLAIVPPRWVADAHFDVDRHLVRGAGGSSAGELWAAAERVSAIPFEIDRPLWQMHLLDGCEGGALVVKLHHTLTDGLGMLKVAAELFDIERHPGDRCAPAASSAAVRPAPDRLWDDLVFEASRSVEVTRRVVPWAVAGVRDAVASPHGRARATQDLANSLAMLAKSARRAASPVLAGKSAGARFGALELPLADFRAAAGRAGGRVNDVFLGGALGGLRLYHAKCGSKPPSLRVGIPVSTRGGRSELDMRNQFAPTVVRAPLQLRDPVERIRLLHDLVPAARRQPVLDLVEHATVMLRRTPGAMKLMAGLLSSMDLMASNVPGSPVDLYLGGAKVRGLVPLGPRSGTGLNLTLLSHVDTVYIGVNMDPVSIPHGDVLLDCLRAGFDETLG